MRTMAMLLAASFAATPASAATFVQTLSIDSVFSGRIAAFDTALGTLQRVSVSAVVRDTRGASIWALDSAFAGDFRMTIAGAAGSSLTRLIDYAGDSGAVTLSNAQPHVSVTGTGGFHADYTGLDLARFTDSGPIMVAIDQARAPDIALFAPDDFNGIVREGLCFGCIAIDHVVTYEYAEAGALAALAAPTLVPEAGSWAMMIAGFGLIGTTLRKVRVARRPARAA